MVNIEFIIKFIPVFIIIGCVLYLCCVLGKKDGFFDIREIFNKYHKIFRDKSILWKVRIPVFILCIVITYLKIINKDIVNSVTLIISILFSAFLGFIPIVSNLREKQVIGRLKNKFYQVCDETNNILFYEIILSVACLFMCFLYMFIGDSTVWIEYHVNGIFQAISAIIYYLSFFILINILIVLRRVATLISFINEKDGSTS